MQRKIKVITLGVILLLGFCLVRDFALKSLIGTVATSITGAPIHIGSLSLSLIGQSARISDFKIYNPKGFAKGVLADIPRIELNCDLKAFMASRIHLRWLELEVNEVSVVKNKEGKLNVDSLKIAAAKPRGKKNPAKELAMQIDVMSLGMGRVINKDCSVEGRTLVKAYDINLKKTYKNIASAQQLAALVIAEPLKAAGIQGLKVYGVSLLSGVAAFPVMAAFTFAARDYAQETFQLGSETVYNAALRAVKIAGRVKEENRQSGVISGEVDGAWVILKLKKLAQESTQVTISARKFGLPHAEIASGVMYRLDEQLK
jgi:hypothetical protein